MNREQRRKHEKHLDNLARLYKSQGVTAEDVNAAGDLEEFLAQTGRDLAAGLIKKGHAPARVEAERSIFFDISKAELSEALKRVGAVNKRPPKRQGIIAIDFDGCLCANAYPDIGQPNRIAIKQAIQAQKAGYALILWTNRTGPLLQEAVDWCERRGLVFDAVNANLQDRIDRYGYDSRKICADIYWDDKAKWTTVGGRTLDAFCRTGINLDVILEGPTGITVQAKGMLDTGANNSLIAGNLVPLLGLKKIGTQKHLTASGVGDTAEYSVNVSFPTLSLKKRTGIRCSEFYIPTDREAAAFGVGYSFIIGRDLMKNWHITIDGPAGTFRIIDEAGIG